MKNVIKFIGVVAGIIAASIAIDKIVDKAYDGATEEHEDHVNVNDGHVDVDVSASTCKTVVKAITVAAVMIIANKRTAKKVCDVAFKYGVEGGIQCTTSAFVDFGLSMESGRRLLTDTDALVRFRDKVLPTVKQAYFG